MIDFDALREELKQESLGGFFTGGFGGALMEASEIERANHDELIKMAKQHGFDLNQYEVAVAPYEGR